MDSIAYDPGSDRIRQRGAAIDKGLHEGISARRLFTTASGPSPRSGGYWLEHNSAGGMSAFAGANASVPVDLSLRGPPTSTDAGGTGGALAGRAEQMVHRPLAA